MTTLDDLDVLFSLRSALDTVNNQEKILIDRFFTLDILNQIKQIRADFVKVRVPLSERINALEKQIITGTIEQGMSIKANYLTAVLNQGHVIWDTPGLQALSSVYPVILDFKSRSDPTVTIRLNKEIVRKGKNDAC